MGSMPFATTAIILFLSKRPMVKTSPDARVTLLVSSSTPFTELSADVFTLYNSSVNDVNPAANPSSSTNISVPTSSVVITGEFLSPVSILASRYCTSSFLFSTLII